MKAVWKFPITVDDEFSVTMPVGAEVVHVDTQPVAIGRVEAFMWALVDPGAETEQREFYVHGTGHPVPDDRVYLGSFMLHLGSFVGHLFEARQ